MKHIKAYLNFNESFGTMKTVNIGDEIFWTPFKSTVSKSGIVIKKEVAEDGLGFKYKVKMRGPKSSSETTVFHMANNVQLRK